MTIFFLLVVNIVYDHGTIVLVHHIWTIIISFLVQAIEKRIAVYSQVPAENGELLQVLRYTFIRKYEFSLYPFNANAFKIIGMRRISFTGHIMIIFLTL